MKFSIRDLLWATFWAAALTASLLAMYRLYQTNDWRPWYSPDRQAPQCALNLCAGTAAGGMVGSFLRSRWRGPLIGLAVSFAATVIWFFYLMITFSAVG